MGVPEAAMSAQYLPASGYGGEPSTSHHWHGVLDSAMDAVGHTPLIKLQRIAEDEGLKCNLREGNPKTTPHVAHYMHSGQMRVLLSWRVRQGSDSKGVYAARCQVNTNLRPR